MHPIPAEAFDELVADALDRLPDELLDLLDNVVVLIDDEHPDDLLGLYEGLPRTEREDYGGFELPDRITLFRVTLCSVCSDLDGLREEITVTVIHELAHHLGIDDDRLAELGWD